MWLTKDAVRLALPGHATAWRAMGGRRCRGCSSSMRIGGGELLVCPICLNARKLDDEAMIPNARVAAPLHVDWIGAMPQLSSATDTTVAAGLPAGASVSVGGSQTLRWTSSGARRLLPVPLSGLSTRSSRMPQLRRCGRDRSIPVAARLDDLRRCRVSVGLHLLALGEADALASAFCNRSSR